MRGTLSAIDQGCLMTYLTYFAQQSCAFTLNLHRVVHRDMVILRALALPAQFMNFKTPPLSYSSAPGSSAILVSPRKRRASLLLLFTACSITPSTSGILIFLETPNATAHPGFSLVRYLSYENLELSDSRILLALSWSWD